MNLFLFTVDRREFELSVSAFKIFYGLLDLMNYPKYISWPTMITEIVDLT